MARRTLLLIASILVAALGTALVWLYVQGADSRAQQGQALVPAYLLSRKLDAGTPVDAAIKAATPTSVPANLGADAVTSPQQLPGQVLTDSVPQGQILLKSMFGATTSTGAQPQRGIITISVADAHRVPAQLRPGDHVAVYELGGRGLKPLQLIEKDITVVSIGSSMQTATGASSAVPLTIVGFDAKPSQAVNLAKIEATEGQAQLYLLGPGTVGTDS